MGVDDIKVTRTGIIREADPPDNASAINPPAAAAPAATETPATTPAAEAAATPATEEKKGDPWTRVAETDRENRRLKNELAAAKKAAEAASGIDDVVKKDPIGFLKSKGVSLDALVEGAAGQPDPDKAEKEALRTKVNELEKWRQEADEAAKVSERNAAIANVKAMAMKVAEAGGDKYELVRTVPGADTLIWNSIREYVDQYGEAPTLDAAVATVEKHLEEQAKPFLSAKKLQPKTGNGTAQPPKTLGNALRGDSPPASEVDDLPTDPDERVLAVMKRFPLGFSQ